MSKIKIIIFVCYLTHFVYQRLTSVVVIPSLTWGAANILKGIIPSTTQGMDSNRCTV